MFYAVALAIGIVLEPFTAQSQLNDVHLTGGRFVELMAKEDFSAAYALFSSRLKAAVPEAELRKNWNDILDQVGRFRRQLDPQWRDNTLIVICQFARGKREIKLSFNGKKEIKSFDYSPPDLTVLSLNVPAYARTNAFHERKFTVISDKWSLPGTLTLPNGAGPLPVVVLVHGSGAGDRDQIIQANRPFRDIAWGLATKGVAVLRYDKRTRIYGANAFTNLATFTVKEEIIDDVLAAAAQLRMTEGIDSKRIFVLGHSLGGTVAPRIAQLDPHLAGLILLAGSTRQFEDLIVEQNRYMLSLDGSMTARDHAQMESVHALASKIKNFSVADVGSRTMVLGAPPGYWLDLRGYDPVATARTFRLPMFILQGSRDYQVTTVDFEGWKAGLGTQTNVTFKLYPTLNHLFMAGQGKSTPMEYDEPGHVEETVLTDIAAWIGSF